MSRPESHPLITEELLRARAEGVGDPGNLPFFLPAVPGDGAAVLLVHGFTATPWEMRPLGEFLAARGLACLAVRLPGHGTTPEDLAGRRWEEWQAAVDSGYRRLSEHFPRVYAAGMSTGSLLLLTLARHQPLPGLVLLSPYLRMQHRLAPLAGWLRHLRPYQKVVVDAADLGRYYDRRPLNGVHQINRLLEALAPHLGEVTAPVLAVQGEGDRTVDLDSGRELLARLGSTVIVHQRLGPEAPHVVVGAGNPHRDTAFDLIGRFLGELEAQRCAPGTR